MKSTFFIVKALAFFDVKFNIFDDLSECCVTESCISSSVRLLVGISRQINSARDLIGLDIEPEIQK